MPRGLRIFKLKYKKADWSPGLPRLANVTLVSLIHPMYLAPTTVHSGSNVYNIPHYPTIRSINSFFSGLPAYDGIPNVVIIMRRIRRMKEFGAGYSYEVMDPRNGNVFNIPDMLINKILDPPHNLSSFSSIQEEAKKILNGDLIYDKDDEEDDETEPVKQETEYMDIEDYRRAAAERRGENYNPAVEDVGGWAGVRATFDDLTTAAGQAATTPETADDTTW